MKTLFLSALASGNRVSELAALSRSSMINFPRAKKARMAICPGLMYKNQTLDNTPPNIMLKALFNEDGTTHRLCAVDALQHWLSLSRDRGTDAIFVNPKTRKAMNRGSISFLLVTTINSGRTGLLLGIIWINVH